MSIHELTDTSSLLKKTQLNPHWRDSIQEYCIEDKTWRFDCPYGNSVCIITCTRLYGSSFDDREDFSFHLNPLRFNQQSCDLKLK